MSILRLFSRSEPNSASGPADPDFDLVTELNQTPQFARSTQGITLHLQIPSFGGVFLPAPRSEHDEPREDAVLDGSVQLVVPPELGPRRCKAVRVRLRSEIILDMGKGRQGERDTLFVRGVEMADGGLDGGGLILTPGMQRFDFTIIIPADLAPHDTHPNARVVHTLFAELEGIIKPDILPQPSSSRSRSRSPARSPGSGSFGFLSRSSPPPRRDTTDSLIATSTKLSISSHDTDLPGLPPYHQTDDPSDADWLEGGMTVHRGVLLFYNPDPAGGFSALDQSSRGTAPGLGPYDLKLVSDIWSIAALLQIRLVLPELQPRVTLFSVRTVLVQIHTIRSPRDDPASVTPITSKRQVPVLELGKRPPAQHTHPSRDTPALWRGVDAGGKDVGPFELEGMGRLPTDDIARPSSLPGVNTYIQVSHALVTFVSFSVWAETDAGQAMSRPDVGGLRVMRVERAVVLPSCLFIPRLLELPVYGTSIPWIKVPGLCEVCKTNRADAYCTQCSHSRIPHMRHDHDPAKVGDPRGVCPACEKDVVVGGSGRKGQVICACDQTLEQIQDRFRELSAVERAEARVGGRAEEAKHEAERGRRA